VPEIKLDPALALVELDSIAAGIEAGDAMAKKAPIETLRAGTVQPGKFLVLIGGVVADVEESLAAGLEVGGACVIDHLILPNVHPDVVRSVGGGREVQPGDALGIVETSTVATAIHAADAGIKGAEVTLLEIRLADGLGGKGLTLFTGLVADVEAAVEIGAESMPSSLLVRQTVISQLHAEMAENINTSTRFGTRLGWTFGVEE
jgi:microcompartment protein CcmL/EutN